MISVTSVAEPSPAGCTRGVKTVRRSLGKVKSGGRHRIYDSDWTQAVPAYGLTPVTP